MTTHFFSHAALAAIALSATSAFAQAPAASPVAASGAAAFRYPEADNKPSSTLRVREITVPDSGSTAAPAPVPVTDTQASVEQYQRCQLVGTRAATSNADMQGRVAQCLAELEARRRAGR